MSVRSIIQSFRTPCTWSLHYFTSSQDSACIAQSHAQILVFFIFPCLSPTHHLSVSQASPFPNLVLSSPITTSLLLCFFKRAIPAFSPTLLNTPPPLCQCQCLPASPSDSDVFSLDQNRSRMSLPSWRSKISRTDGQTLIKRCVPDGRIWKHSDSNATIHTCIRISASFHFRPESGYFFIVQHSVIFERVFESP